MRAFLAIELPADVQHALAALQRELAVGGVKWVEPENLHLTLRFLGEITDDQRHAIEARLAEVAQEHAPIDAALTDVGTFPDRGMPRVIWVGIGPGGDQLRRLAEEMEERRFVAHVTLGRARSPRGGQALRQRLGEVRWTPPPPFRIAHVTLFQSTLSPTGPTYTPLAKAYFKTLGDADTR